MSQNFWQMVSKVCLKFPKFATNLAISLRSCQSNRGLWNKVVNFTPTFIAKFIMSEVLVIRCSWFGDITTNEFEQHEKISQPSKAYFMMFTSEMRDSASQMDGVTSIWSTVCSNVNTKAQQHDIGMFCFFMLFLEWLMSWRKGFFLSLIDVNVNYF